MLAKIILLTAFNFSILYPLCFLISARDPLKNNFHKFHLGLPNVVGGVVIVSLFFFNLPLKILLLCLFWKVVLIFTSRYFWKKTYPNPYLMTLPCLLGIIAYSQLQAFLIAPGFNTTLIGILAGLILTSSIYAMNLGHWYLNVHGLPMSHLQRATYVFWFLLALRLLWDLLFILSSNIVYRGDTISMLHFMNTLDGFLLWVALFFGTLFPLVSLYFVKGTLDVKNTQSATGILYAILSSVIIGDISYKYYLIKYAIPL